ncbi:MAG: prolyl aminopeptidase [Fibrobacterota bacterium]|nr:prolyl aminopeptidase [Fibrobacterota bacterium]
MATNGFFPDIEPYHTGTLQVSPIHNIYFEEAGNPNGVPVLFLHGGPGAGINPKHRRYFDPDHYRIILFDQRGAGRSQPHAEIIENTTDHLINDIEKLRRLLHVENWLLFGGSWGSTLALAYAIRHPSRITGLILRGVFLGRKSEVRWLFQEGASAVFPDFWEKFLSPIPHSERKDLVSAYYRRLTSEDSGEQLRSAQAWSGWEASVCKLIPDEILIGESIADRMALSLARLECHYCLNGLFLPGENHILDNAGILNGIRCRIVQGRYDMACPPYSAWDLHKALPGSEIRIVPDAGHSATEPGLLRELVQATEDFKTPPMSID